MFSLSGCLITDESCTSLASALSANNFHMRELDLTKNHLQDSGVKLLSAALDDPYWRLDCLKYGQIPSAHTQSLCQTNNQKLGFV